MGNWVLQLRIQRLKRIHREREKILGEVGSMGQPGIILIANIHTALVFFWGRVANSLSKAKGKV
jgi:hypothetical protein